MSISGPRIQPPSAQSRLLDFIYGPDGQIADMHVNPDWAILFAALQRTALAVSRSGLTADRPTSTMPGRFVGMPFFDTTIGKPIWLKSVQPDSWIDATGAGV
jgi:hypothetical protein